MPMRQCHAHSTLSLPLSKHLDPFICYRVPVGGLEILGEGNNVWSGRRACRMLQAGAVAASLWNKELVIRPTFLTHHPHHPATQWSPKKVFDGTQLVAGQCPGQAITKASLLESSAGTQSQSATQSQGG